MEDIKLYTMHEFQDIMGIGKNTAYKLVKIKGFPSIQIGNKILIPKDKLHKWIENNNGSKIMI